MQENDPYQIEPFKGSGEIGNLESGLLFDAFTDNEINFWQRFAQQKKSWKVMLGLNISCFIVCFFVIFIAESLLGRLWWGLLTATNLTAVCSLIGALYLRKSSSYRLENSFINRLRRLGKAIHDFNHYVEKFDLLKEASSLELCNISEGRKREIYERLLTMSEKIRNEYEQSDKHWRRLECLRRIKKENKQGIKSQQLTSSMFDLEANKAISSLELQPVEASHFEEDMAEDLNHLEAYEELAV